MGTWKDVTIHNLRRSPRHTTFLTRQENTYISSSPGTVSLWSKKCGSHSRHIFANTINNSPVTDNWPSKNLDTGKQIFLKTLWAAFPQNLNTKKKWWTAPHLNILHHQSQQELQIFYKKFSLRIKNWCNFFPPKMGKVAGITPTGLLLLTPDLVKDNLFIQCPHISINISEHMGVAPTRVETGIPRHSYTRTYSQWISWYMGATMDARNDGVGWYQR